MFHLRITSRTITLALSLAVALYLTDALAAQAPEQQRVQLLAPGTGYLASGSEILWTADNGNNWKEITPDLHNTDRGVVSVFFLNQSTGWALLASGAYGETKFELASTNDSGATWSITPVHLNINPNEYILVPQGYFQFTDATHGWINLDVESGSAFHGGYLLRTVDGGKNWIFVGGPSSGEIRFMDPENGWLVYDRDLWVTHDAAAHWEQVSLKPPSEINSRDRAFYHLPVLTDQKHAALEIDFESAPTQSPDHCWQTLFVTSDAGRSWTFKQILTRERECKHNVEASAGNSNVIVADSSGETLTLQRFDLAGNTTRTSMSSDIGFLTAIRSASFVNSQRGWILSTAACTTACSTCALRPTRGVKWGPGGGSSLCPALLSTSDAGRTWNDITWRGRCVIDSRTWKKTCTREYGGRSQGVLTPPSAPQKR